MFKKAVRNKTKLKIAITGVSGSGKTFSALRLASGMGKRIAVIDTENGSAQLYAGQVGQHKFEFDVCTLTPPFTIDKYVQAIRSASDDYDVLIIDSLTHAWAGEGGLLEKKERLDASGNFKEKFTNWGVISTEHQKFLSSILQSQTHIIATMRSKQEHVVERDDKGKTIIRKAGLAPVQRDGVDYEFTTVFDINQNHLATVSKDRTSLFSSELGFQITEETGKSLIDWTNSGHDNSEELKGAAAFSLMNAKSIQELQEAWNAIPFEFKKALTDLKDEKKSELVAASTPKIHTLTLSPTQQKGVLKLEEELDQEFENQKEIINV